MRYRISPTLLLCSGLLLSLSLLSCGGSKSSSGSSSGSGYGSRQGGGGSKVSDDSVFGELKDNRKFGTKTKPGDLKYWKAFNTLHNWWEDDNPEFKEVLAKLQKLPVQGVQDQKLIALHQTFAAFIENKIPLEDTLDTKDPEFSKKMDALEADQKSRNGKALRLKEKYLTLVKRSRDAYGNE